MRPPAAAAVPRPLKNLRREGASSEDVSVSVGCVDPNIRLKGMVRQNVIGWQNSLCSFVPHRPFCQGLVRGAVATVRPECRVKAFNKAVSSFITVWGMSGVGVGRGPAPRWDRIQGYPAGAKSSPGRRGAVSSDSAEKEGCGTVQITAVPPLG